MVEPASFEALDQAIDRVLDAETTNFFEIAEMLGLDPKQDFAGADLSGTDFFEGNLAGANFVETDLRGANFAYAKLQGANLTDANLGILPSSYLARAKELNRLITSYLDLTIASANALTNARDRDDAIGSIPFFDLTRAGDLFINLASARNLALSLASTRDLTSNLVILDLISNLANILASARNLALDLASDLDFDLDFAPDLAITRDLTIDCTRNLASGLSSASALASNLTIDRDLARVHELIRMIGGGANFYKANLTGVALDGANVEGAIMIDCIGLSDAEIADLKSRGAIFDNLPGDRSEVRMPTRR